MGVYKTYLFAVTVLTVTELKVIFEHAGMNRDTDTVGFKIFSNNFFYYTNRKYA